MKKIIIPVIVGPTASGKTSLSIKLAKKISGEIISADSMQIYRKMNIGTAKVTEIEKENIKHHLIDIINAEDRYSVSNFVQDAKKAIIEIIQNKHIPIIVGGTGLYVNSLIYGYDFEKMDNEELKKFRAKLDKKIERGEETLETLYEKAKQIDEKASSKISVKDKKRIYRIFEMYYILKDTKTNIDKKRNSTKTEILLIGNEKVCIEYLIFNIVQERQFLYNIINQRILKMVEKGLIKEVSEILKELKEKNIDIENTTSMQAIGYKEVVEYLNNDITKEEMLEKLCKDTRHYAKRQITWFKRLDKIDLDYTKLAEVEQSDVLKIKAKLDNEYLEMMIRSIG